MKLCKSCKIKTSSNRSTCPLCGFPLKGKNIDSYETFPEVKTIYNRYHFFLKILLVFSVIASFICILINLIIPSVNFWSIFVIIGIICMWISLINAITKLKNITKSIISQAFIINILAIIWDIITGWHNWSLTYVIPLICITTIISIGITSKLLKHPIEDYLIYLIIDIFLCLIPILFLIFDMVSLIYPSIICILVSLISLIIILIFEGQNLKDELRKRFHF